MSAAPKVYVAGPDGFTTAGLKWHNEVLIPLVRSAGFEPLDPWSDQAGAEFEQAEQITDHGRRLSALAAVNEKIGLANRRMIEECDVVLANCEGDDVDSGTAAEIGFAFALGKKVFAFREDLRRTGDNDAAPINLQVLHFVNASGGCYRHFAHEAVAAMAQTLDQSAKSERGLW